MTPTVMKMKNLSNPILENEEPKTHKEKPETFLPRQRSWEREREIETLKRNREKKKKKTPQNLKLMVHLKFQNEGPPKP